MLILFMNGRHRELTVTLTFVHYKKCSGLLATMFEWMIGPTKVVFDRTIVADGRVNVQFSQSKSVLDNYFIGGVYTTIKCHQRRYII